MAQVKSDIGTVVLKEDMMQEINRLEDTCKTLDEMKAQKAECSKNKVDFTRLIEHLRSETETAASKIKHTGKRLDDF